MAGAMRCTRIPAPRNGGQKLIQRRRACALEPPRSFRRMLRVMSGLWLRRDSQAPAVDGFEDLVAPASQQRCAGFFAKFFGVGAVPGVAKNFRAVGVRDDGFEVKLAVLDFGKGADGYLAASAQTVEESALAGGGA